MSIRLVERENDLVVLQVESTCNLADAEQAQKYLAEAIKQIGTVRALILLENFTGWDNTEKWTDLALLGEQDDDAKAIAIVGDTRWKDEALLFLLAGMRQAEVQFFMDESKARSWLDEHAPD